MTTLNPATICYSSSSKYLTRCLIRQRLLLASTYKCMCFKTLSFYHNDLSISVNQIELISPKSYDIVTLERSLLNSISGHYTRTISQVDQTFIFASMSRWKLLVFNTHTHTHTILNKYMWVSDTRTYGKV